MRSTFPHWETNREKRVKASTPTSIAERRKHGNRENDELSNVDHVVTGAKPSHFEAMLCSFFEDNEAVI